MSAFVKKQQQLQEYVVSGYLRQTNKYDIYFPLEIIHLCLIFYMIAIDQWNIELSDNEQMSIDPKLNTITRVAERTNFFNAFGTVTLTKGDVHKWKFRILEARDERSKTMKRRFVDVGIIDASANVAGINHTHAFWQQPAGVLLSAITYHGAQCYKTIFDSDIQEYGEFWTASTDSIIMTLDLRAETFGKLSIESDTEDFGILYDKIDVNKQWRMALTMLLSYTIQLSSIDCLD